MWDRSPESVQIGDRPKKIYKLEEESLKLPLLGR
jgi:hypothetical protein